MINDDQTPEGIYAAFTRNDASASVTKPSMSIISGAREAIFTDPN
jgi:hypothetical protein